MSNLITGLDNVGAICHANEETFNKFRRMGFTTYPLGRQGVKLGGVFIKGGTGSIVANFRKGGYFEMISIYNNWLPNGGYKKTLAKQGERLTKFTMALSNAKEEAKRLKTSGKSVFGPLEFRRVFTSETKGKQDARFSIMVYPFPSDYPVAVAGTEHLTPDIAWQNDLLDHPNGAVILSNALLAVNNLDETAALYQQIFREAFAIEGNTRVCHLRNVSRLTLISHANLPDEIQDVKPDTSPFLAAVYFGVSEIEKVKRILEENGVPYQERNGRLIVPGTYLFNASFIFEQEQ